MKKNPEKHTKMKIRDREDLLRVLVKKIEWAREKAWSRMRGPYAAWSKEDFMPHEVEKKPIKEGSYVSDEAWRALSARKELLERLNGKKNDLHFVNGKTRVCDILDYFYPRHSPESKKPKKKSKKKK